MKICVDDKNSQNFIRHLASLLKPIDSMFFESESFLQVSIDNHFETGIYHSIEGENVESKKSLWLISQNDTGKISKVEVTVVDLLDNECDYREYIYKKIQQALVNSISNSGSYFFTRNYYCFIHTSNLDGEYWINKNLRLAPLYPEDKEFGSGLERIVVFDQNIKAIDELDALQIAEEKSIFLSAHLSLLFDIGFYTKRRNCSRWVRYNDTESGRALNKRFDLDVVDLSNQTTMPEKMKRNLSNPIHTVFHDEKGFYEMLSFPKETRVILKSLEYADHKDKLAFNRCCRLYQTALVKGYDSPTIKFSYLYASVDAICKTTGDFDGFSDFMRHYSPGINEDTLKYIHEKIRSSHWHSGNFILGENESNWHEFLHDKEILKRHKYTFNLQQTIRQSILSWTFKKIVRRNYNHDNINANPSPS